MTLVVNCTFTTGTRSAIAAVISLILSRSKAATHNPIELASLNQFSAQQVNLLTTGDNITATGSIDADGVSYLSLKWDSPSDVEAGVYTCAARGMDPFGHIIVETDESQVTLVHLSTDQPSDILQELKENVRHLETKYKQISEEISSNIDDLNTKLVDNRHVLEVLETRLTAMKRSLFEVPMTYQNSSYVLSRHNWRNLNNAKAMCELYDGYLVEIDDEQEFTALSEFLNHTTGVDGVLTGGTDLEDEGHYVFQESKEPMVYQNWAILEPDNTTLSKIVVVVNPTTLDPDVDRSFTVNCTFSRGAQTNMAAIVSLIVSRSQISNNFIELASINEYSNNQVTVFGSENMTATGSIDPLRNSFISLYWTSVSTRETGNYRCSAHGIDSVGHSIVESEDAEVRILLRPDPDQLNRTILLQERAKNIDLRLSEFKNTTDQEISAFQQDIKNSESFISLVRERFETIVSTLFDRPVRFQNSSYFLSKHNWGYPSLDKSTCEMLGGRLLEINDGNEFKAVSDFLSRGFGFDGVLTGGNDEDKDGAYVFMGSGREMVYKNWVPGEPKGGPDQNCVVLVKESGWRMAVKRCFDNRLNYRFVCETEL